MSATVIDLNAHRKQKSYKDNVIPFSLLKNQRKHAAFENYFQLAEKNADWDCIEYWADSLLKNHKEFISDSKMGAWIAHWQSKAQAGKSLV